jgi:hypothetical protein
MGQERGDVRLHLEPERGHGVREEPVRQAHRLLLVQQLPGRLQELFVAVRHGDPSPVTGEGRRWFHLDSQLLQGWWHGPVMAALPPGRARARPEGLPGSACRVSNCRPGTPWMLYASPITFSSPTSRWRKRLLPPRQKELRVVVLDRFRTPPPWDTWCRNTSPARFSALVNLCALCGVSRLRCPVSARGTGPCDGAIGPRLFPGGGLAVSPIRPWPNPLPPLRLPPLMKPPPNPPP